MNAKTGVPRLDIPGYLHLFGIDLSLNVRILARVVTGKRREESYCVGEGKRDAITSKQVVDKEPV
jgi:hypothetical protein